MHERVEIVAAIVVDSCQRILMAQRADWQHQGGKWEFPGGKVNLNETYFEAIRREIKEELGINLDICKIFIHLDFLSFSYL